MSGANPWASFPTTQKIKNLGSEIQSRGFLLQNVMLSLSKHGSWHSGLNHASTGSA
jgi:hypothetical protein